MREDSGWDVPEPELALVISAAGEIVGYTIGNDVSSRSIEGENPLYLPQAKVYRGSCALGPCDRARRRGAARRGDGDHADDRPRRRGRLHGLDAGRAAQARAGRARVWLFQAQDFPVGAVLLTGTSVIPAIEFTLRGGDEVRIAITGLGELVNTVEVV